MKNKMKYIVIVVLTLAVCSAGVVANNYWYNTTPCDAIDISLTDARVVDFLDRTNMATVDVYNCEYRGYNAWLVCWHTQTQSQRVYIDIYSGEIIGTAPEPEPCWHTVTTFQGRHDSETPIFTIKGDIWRINWETVGHENESQISVTVYKDFGFLDYTYVDVFYGNNNFPFTDTRYEYDGAGTYYLNIYADDLECWSLEIEDFY
jgi:hypothetical protein